MIVDGERIIREQLSGKSVNEVLFSDGSQTKLIPARTVPTLNDPGARLDLDGDWKVKVWPFRQKEERLVSPRTSDKRWASVSQPGKVLYADPQGDAKPHPKWNRVTLEHIDAEDGAVIRRSVTVPRAWRGKRIYLRFDAIFPAGRIYLNGNCLGEHLSGLTPIEFDVTDRVRPGAKALVAVRLIRKHKYVQMDMVRHALEFAGLAQSACFHATEAVQIADYHIIPELDKRCAKGSVAGSVVLANRSDRPRTASLQFALSREGFTLSSSPRKVRLAPGTKKTVRVRLSVAKPSLWNDEFPNLYAAKLILKAGRQSTQCVSWNVGFRRLDLSPKGPKLNGRPVKFRGVNHLTFHPDHGMYTPEDWLRRNLKLMKKANVNAIRTHFLGPRCLAPLCDELGLYLIQELPIDWGTNYIHKPEWVGPALTRIEGGIRRDRHAPSVMAWAIGNENMPESGAVAADGWNHMRIYDAFAKRLDPSRPSLFPPPGPANKIDGIFETRVGDIADTHYSFNLIRRFNKTNKLVSPNSWEADSVRTTREQAIRDGWSGAWFSSEYGLMCLMPDLLNNPYISIIDDVPKDPLSGRGTMDIFIERLRREWGYMRDDPTCLGGTFFPWICAGAGEGEEGNPWGWVRWAEDADWGVVCADLTPKPFFWGMRKLFSPVWFPERLTWKKGQKAIQFEVTNQFNQIDLKDCTLRVMMGGGGPYMTMMRHMKDVSMRCAPGRKATIRIPLFSKGSQGSLKKGMPIAVRCALLDPSGFRVMTHDILVVPRKLGGASATHMPIGPDA